MDSKNRWYKRYETLLKRVCKFSIVVPEERTYILSQRVLKSTSEKYKYFFHKGFFSAKKPLWYSGNKVSFIVGINYTG